MILSREDAEALAKALNESGDGRVVWTVGVPTAPRENESCWVSTWEPKGQAYDGIEFLYPPHVAEAFDSVYCLGAFLTALSALTSGLDLEWVAPFESTILGQVKARWYLRYDSSPLNGSELLDLLAAALIAKDRGDTRG